MKQHPYKFTSKIDKIRLDCLVSEHFAISRQKAIKLIENNQVYLNNILRNKKDMLISIEDIMHMNIEIQTDNENTKKKPLLSYLEINDDFIVVNKPYGISSARSTNTPSEEYILNELVQEEYSLSKSIRPEEFGLVHRLDKTTEGVMILSRTEECYTKLLDLFKEKITKTYLAIVEIKKSNVKTEDNIELPLFYGHDKVLIKLNDRSVNSITKYTIIKSYQFSKGNFAVVEIIPYTGKRHQIRAVLSHIGMPIIGDTLYGGYPFERVCLYSSKLEMDSLSFSLYQKHLHDINNLLMWLM